MDYSPLVRTRGNSNAAALRLAAAASEVRNNASDDATGRHAFGVANLIDRRWDDALVALREATAMPGATAEHWNDLAAALLEIGSQRDEPDAIAAALGAADHALRLEPALLVALFNRAIALELLHLHLAADAAYRDYLRADPHSGWATEVRERISRLERADRAGAWKDEMPRLFAAVERGDQQAVHGVVDAFAQPARTWGEVEFLHDWATAVESGDEPRAAAKLQLASTVGRSLADRNDEHLLLDAAESIRRAERTGQRAIAARAQRQYRQGRFLYSKRLVAKAGPLFEEARRDYAAIVCPLALMAEYYSASVLYDSDRTAAALELTESLFQRTPPRYRALRAQLHWLRGTILVNRGQLRSALDDYRTAMAAFDNMRERENASIMRDNVALTLALLGRGDEAWRLRRKAFSEASTSGDPTRVHLALTVASRQSIQEEQWDVVWSLLHLAVQSAPVDNPRLRADAILWRALAAVRGGETSSDLGAARTAIAEIKDDHLRAAAESDLHLAQGILKRPYNAEASVQELSAVVAFAAENHKSVLLPIALVERARSFRALKDDRAAEADLRRAAEMIETRRDEIAETDLREAMLGTAAGVYDELLDVVLARGDARAAFEVAERRQSRRIMEELFRREQTSLTAPLTATQIEKAVREDVLIASYARAGDRLVIFTVSSEAVEWHRVQSSRASILRLRDDFLAAIRANDGAAIAAGAETLYDELVSPYQPAAARRQTLVIVANDDVVGIPFSALRDAGRSQYLIEQTQIVFAPSASTYAHAVRLTRPLESVERAAVIGAPVLTPSRAETLPALPFAEREARAIAALYGTEPLTGREADVPRAIALMRDADVVHIATHAIAERSDASASSLLLAPGGTTDALHVHDIVDLRLTRRPVVILAGCDTGTPVASRDGIHSLALAFLAAGSRSVIGTKWEIDDEATSDLSVWMHRAMRRGLTPAAALRDAQIAALRTTNGKSSAPRVWAALQVYGAGL